LDHKFEPSVNTTILRFCLLGCLLAGNISFQLKAQRSLSLVLNQSYLNGFNLSETAIREEISQGVRTTQSDAFNFGNGIEWGFQLASFPDSFGLFWTTGLGYFNGSTQDKYALFDKDLSLSQFRYIDPIQFFIQLGLGYTGNLIGKLNWSTAISLNLPVISQLNERAIYNTGLNSFERIDTRFKTTFSPGFVSKTGLSYALAPQIVFSLSGVICFQNMAEKSSKIIAFKDQNNQSLQTRFPTISERESKYYKDISAIQNNPNLFPNEFDSNKPIDNLSKNMSFSRIGFEFSIAYQISRKKTKDQL
jgi:hypothetical protein